MHVSAAALGDQKMAPDSLELELEVVVIYPAWALGVKLRSFCRTAGALSCWIISPATHVLLLIFKQSRKLLLFSSTELRVKLRAHIHYTAVGKCMESVLHRCHNAWVTGALFSPS